MDNTKQVKFGRKCLKSVVIALAKTLRAIMASVAAGFVTYLIHAEGAPQMS